MKTILVTGAAGFIGYHLCERLVKEGYRVIGLDNINDYYDVNLKYARLKNLGIEKESIDENKLTTSRLYKETFQFIKITLEDRKELPKLFEKFAFDCVCNLAAQAGVRYSLEKPMVYVDSNIVGFVNLLECCRHFNVKKLIYASSSSVYGNCTEVPFNINQRVDRPISLYAATKKSNELMAYTYSHLFDITTIGLRFFTVYGPWGRPDMAMFLFTDAILKNQPIQVFNGGNLWRDFTYIDDIISGVFSTIKYNHPDNKYQLYNIGNNKSVKLTDFITEIEKVTNRKSIKIMLPLQPGDVNQTWANIDEIKKNYDYEPSTTIEEGVRRYIKWYLSYYCE